MMYDKSDVMRLARRWNNSKRSYLLVNPLQAKHIPVSPSKAFEMMCSLGNILKDTNASLVIGFAETATAVGAVCAMCFPDDIPYMHTTRENYDSEVFLEFSEEHSHAVEQKLFSTPLSRIRPEKVVMIDDEISTGKTIENIVDVIRREFPHFRDCEFIVGSVINRVESQREKELSEKNIKFMSLVRMNDDNLEQAVSGINAEKPALPDKSSEYSGKVIFTKSHIPDMRKCFEIGYIKEKIKKFTDECISYLRYDLDSCRKVLVLGTEECMIPAIMLGMSIEKIYDAQVYTHSTTRSPIGINNAEDYPCRNGFQIQSFYENERVNYLYNIDEYDRVIVVTDSRNDIQCERAFRDIMSVFPDCKFYLVRG